AVPREIAPGERRVALTPDMAAALVKGGLAVLIETGAGAGAFHADAAYEQAGARIVPDAGTLYAEADVVLKVQKPALDAVAGLQAIATARRLGAQVWGYDVRTAVKEQVESLGAKFLALDVGIADAEDRGGYAKALSPEASRRQQAMLAEKTKEFDVVVTTALVPGRPAPRLVTKETVAGMRPRPVLVRRAAEAGGHCGLTEPR